MTTTEVKPDRPRPRPRPYPSPPVDEPRAEPQPRSRLRAVLIVSAAAVVVLGFVAANVWLFTIRSSNDTSEQARTDALAAARTRIPAMLSYSYKDITSYVSGAPKNTTGDFRKDFTQLVTTVIEPAAKQQHISTKATVKSAGIIEGHESTVVVLVMIDQTTTSDSAKGGRIDGSRVRVTMMKSGGTWLVDDMTPV